MDLMGPFPVTPQGNNYVLTMTDLFTKWVIAEPLKRKTAAEVAAVVLDKLFEFGVVERIITDQGREFVNQLNEDMFKVLGVKQCVTSAYHPQSNGQDERTNQTIKRVLSKYCNDKQNDWDRHLKGVVYAINTSKQASTKYTPYFLMFNRHPLMAGTLNKKIDTHGDSFVVENPEVGIDDRIAEVTALRAKVLDNIELAKKNQKIDYESRKRKNVKSFHIHEGEEVLKANKRKEGRKGGRLESNWTGPFVVKDITEKGLATLVDKSGTTLFQKTNVSQLKPYLRRNISLDVYTRDHDYCKNTEMTTAAKQDEKPRSIPFSVDQFKVVELEEELYLRILNEESNEKRPLVKFVRCQATLEDFKTLCPETRSFPWLNDDIVDSRIAQLCKAYGGTALQVHSFVHMWRTFTYKQVVEDSIVSFLKDLDEDGMVLMPRIVGGDSPEKGNHFILWVLDGLERQIRVYDSLGSYKSISKEDMTLLSDTFRNTWDLKNWTVTYPAQWMQSDFSNCGVLVCTMAEMELRNKWTLMKPEVLLADDLWHLRRYHAASLAAYAVQNIMYKRTKEEVKRRGIVSLVSDSEIQEIFQGIQQGSVKSTWNRWWISKGRKAVPRSFHPAIASNIEDLTDKIFSVLFEGERKCHDEVFHVLLPEITILILKRTEGFSKFWAEISYLVECVIKIG
nr:uncharacterized protein LOC129439799 [Misgurnus anguillicaudatus]